MCKKINEKLLDMHQNDYYPIKSFIIAKKILSSASIVDMLKKVFFPSSACVIILTFDDVGNSRVRQDVLIEIGIALMLIKRENCFFISEKVPLPDNFLSDLKTSINPNYFNREKLDMAIDNTCAEIIRHLNINSCRNILNDFYYKFDYRKVPDDIPSSIMEEKADIQLEDILKEWENNIKSFDFVDERIMYLAERLKFLPIFKNNKRFLSFFLMSRI